MGTTSKSKSLKQSLTMGLIYPAVLGNIIYLFLGALATSIVPSLENKEWNPSPEKWALLAIALVFYFCDYLYTEFTLPDHFGWCFFLFEFIFLFCLYISATAVHMKEDSLPQTNVIACCYIIFMVFYLIWDAVEFKRASSAGDRAYYRWVMIWEGVSIALLVSWRASDLSDSVLLPILVGITFVFVLIVIFKAKRYRASA